VPIPGAQQRKRPRRRYEEIERMYKCGWGGSEKSHSTSNRHGDNVTTQPYTLKHPAALYRGRDSTSESK
jgi:hypothetical protein